MKERELTQLIRFFRRRRAIICKAIEKLEELQRIGVWRAAAYQAEGSRQLKASQKTRVSA